MAVEVIKTIKPSGGDYTSLSAWEAGEQGDLVAADQIRTAECYSMSDTAAVMIDGWTTDAARYIRIYTPAAERHGGKWDSAKYRIERTLTANGQSAIDNREDYVRIDGLQVLLDFNNGNWTGASGIYVYWSINPSNDIRISRNIIRASNQTTWSKGAGINLNDADAVVRIWDNVIYDFKSTNVSYGKNGILATACASAYVYNNTVQNCTEGFARTAGAVVVKNNIAQDCTDGFAGVFDGASDYNLSDLASDAPGANSRNSTVVTFADKANDDFHLASGDTAAKDFGTDLSGDAYLSFSDDIDVQTRSGTWDIGADEYVSSGNTYYESTTLGFSLAEVQSCTLALNEAVALAEGLGLTDNSTLSAVATLALALSESLTSGATADLPAAASLALKLTASASGAPPSGEKASLVQRQVLTRAEALLAVRGTNGPARIVRGSPQGKITKN
jgi:hypothetical protein